MRLETRLETKTKSFLLAHHDLGGEEGKTREEGKRGGKKRNEKAELFCMLLNFQKWRETGRLFMGVGPR